MRDFISGLVVYIACKYMFDLSEQDGLLFGTMLVIYYQLYKLKEKVESNAQK